MSESSSPALTAHGSEPFKLNLPDGIELRLAKITPHDWIVYRDKFRTNRKVRLAQSLRYAGLPADQVEKKLDAYDTRKLRQADVIQWILDLEGAGELLALSASHGWEVWKNGERIESVKAAERTAKDVPAIIPFDSYVDAAAGVAEVALVPGEPDPKKEDQPPTATGDATPTESASG